jgi:DNA-binding beta-propeller fold protein YncE
MGIRLMRKREGKSSIDHGQFQRAGVRSSLLIAILFITALGTTQQYASTPPREEAASPGWTAEELSEGLPLSALFSNPCMMPEAVQVPAQDGRPSADALGGDIPAIRAIEDPFPAFNGVAVDPENNLVVMSDTNKKSLLIYDRARGSKGPETTQPLRQILGPTTLLGFVCGVAFDAPKREIFAVNNDIEDTMMIFSYEDSGDLKPKRTLAIPHGSWGISLSKARNEFSLSVQDGSNNAVVTYKKESKGFDPPIRVLQGRETMLADPHGIYVDDSNNELIVTNWGSWNVRLGRYTSTVRERPDPAGGRFDPPSITFYDATAKGNTKPSRQIQGPATQLSWPAGIDVDLESNEIVVANNADDSVLVFRRTAAGNVKPLRVIKGSRTGIRRPMSVAIDKKNRELWVANFGDHTALVFDLAAGGNASPKRIVRNAPAGTPSVGFGNPMSVAYDPKRDEILVPN